MLMSRRNLEQEIIKKRPLELSNSLKIQKIAKKKTDHRDDSREEK